MSPAGAPGLPNPTLRQAVPVWLRVAALSFGGPAGQIAVMHRILVEERRWISERRFLHGLGFCTLLPGPEAQQLATYIGWLMHGPAGGLVAGGLFVMPGLLALMGLSWLYVLYGTIDLVAGLFFGLKAAVLAIVLHALWRLGGRALRGRTDRLIAGAAFVAIFALAVPFPLVVVVAGVLGLVLGRKPAPAPTPAEAAASGEAGFLIGEAMLPRERAGPADSLRVGALWLAIWLLPVVALLVLPGPAPVFGQVALFFSKMAVVTFGGAYAALAYVAQQAVEHYGWLRPGEMLDGLGLAETTPGPLIMVLQFVGFLAGYRAPGTLPPLLAGTLAGLLTTWVTFAPCFLWIFAGAPLIGRLRGSRLLAGALSAITAAVAGVILNLAVWFGLRTLFGAVRTVPLGPLRLDVPVLASLDPAALVLTLLAVLAVFRLNLGALPTLALCAGAGMLLRLSGLA
ncbi:chromate efflux transporter [Methylobacterium brachiatum]|uniref:chromate efflux transporter n=1 Tax=Methylobacterium brachiatum TaxID=269660 RepID=UPI0008DFB19C|nr:chromate transporter [Methylobacterium brachiatum]AYO85175.1 chromate transporter [Methylobacterium brachiatum]MDH2309931.1 chromate efflux transporter [Methylobacterium brachiatum]SFI07700.1 chromate transporter [Methylobacterium brachiatum]